MSLRLFRQTLAGMESKDAREGYMKGFVDGVATAKKVYFPNYLPIQYQNSTFTDVTYGDNQEDVTTEYMPICMGNEHSCKFDIYFLIERIESTVNDGLSDYPTGRLTPDTVQKYIERVNMINKVKDELNTFALLMMRRRIEAVKEMTRGAPCTVWKKIREDATEFNQVVREICDGHPICTIDTDTMNLRC